MYPKKRYQIFDLVLEPPKALGRISAASSIHYANLYQIGQMPIINKTY